jgi:hypothetical protein
MNEYRLIFLLHKERTMRSAKNNESIVEEKLVAPAGFLRPEGDLGVKELGHRAYVGGAWEEIGSLQFKFLLSKGLKPSSYLLDIACGALRLGIKAISYLDCSHYLGLEKEPDLIQAGLEKELGSKLRAEKQPNIVISSTFEFEKLAQKANFAIAQSLFTHLPPHLIHLCFKNLYPCIEEGGAFYATFFETHQKINNPEKSHDHGYFIYTQTEMCEFGEINGFKANYIGNWNHPRKQMMVEYRKN